MLRPFFRGRSNATKSRVDEQIPLPRDWKPDGAFQHRHRLLSRKPACSSGDAGPVHEALTQEISGSHSEQIPLSEDKSFCEDAASMASPISSNEGSQAQDLQLDLNKALIDSVDSVISVSEDPAQMPGQPPCQHTSSAHDGPHLGTSQGRSRPASGASQFSGRSESPLSAPQKPLRNGSKMQ